MTPPSRSPVPWKIGDLLVLYATTSIGIVLVLAAWYAASGEVRLEDQARWATLGTAGVIVLGAGNLAWLLAGRRATGELRRHLLARAPGAETTQASSAARRTSLVAGKTMTRFHRADCPLVQGKTVRAQTRATHERRGRRPCDVCTP